MRTPILAALVLAACGRGLAVRVRRQDVDVEALELLLDRLDEAREARNFSDYKSMSYAKTQYEAIVAAKGDPDAVVMLALRRFQSGIPQRPWVLGRASALA